MPSVALIYGTRVRRSDFYVKRATRVVCRNGHEQPSPAFLFCSTCGKKYVTEDVVEPTSDVARMMHERFVNTFDNWWDEVRGDLADGDPGVTIWRADPIQREGDWLRVEQDWDAATFVLGVRLSETDASDPVPTGLRILSLADLLEVDRDLRRVLPAWGVPEIAECRLYPVLYVR